MKEHIQTTIDGADEYIHGQFNQHAAGGLAVGIVHRGELVYARGFGWADYPTRRPVTPDTSFRIGSISKTFTAIGIMQLWEQGKIDLDAPVNDYLKSYRFGHPDPNAPPITFRHIFTHRTGLGDIRSWRELIPGQPISISAHRGQAPPLREFYAEGLTTELHPGRKWAYDNHAYGTLGQIIEDVSGQPFGQYMIHHVFEPLGMNQTDYFLTERVQDFATGYQPQGGPLERVDYTDIVIPGAGSIFSSVNQMALYVAALMNGGANEHGRVLREETLAMMMERQWSLDERLPAMGMTFWLENAQGHRIAQHGGGWPGFISMMLVAPDDELAVLAFTNCGNRSSYDVSLGLMQQLLQIAPESVTPPYPEIQVEPLAWAELTGVYQPAPGFSTNGRVWAAYGGGFEVKVEGPQLMLKPLGGLARAGLPLHHADAEDPLAFQLAPPQALWTSVMLQPNWVLFQRDGGGQVDRLQLGFLEFHKRQSVISAGSKLSKPVQTLELNLQKRRAEVVAWYSQQMPNKWGTFKYVFTRFLLLCLVWMILRGRRR